MKKNHLPTLFSTRESAMRYAMENHLEHCAFVHPSHRGGFILVWWNEGTQSMVGAIDTEHCCILSDW